MEHLRPIWKSWNVVTNVRVTILSLFRVFQTDLNSSLLNLFSSSLFFFNESSCTLRPKQSEKQKQTKIYLHPNVAGKTLSGRSSQFSITFIPVPSPTTSASHHKSFTPTSSTYWQAATTPLSVTFMDLNRTVV